MTRNALRSLIVVVLAAILITACATPGAVPPPMDVQPIPSGKYSRKVDYLFFILDASSSMDAGYNGQNKFETARAVIGNFNKTMPSVSTRVALRSFGHHSKVSGNLTNLVAELKPYDPVALQAGLGKVSNAGGTSPLAQAIGSAAKDLEGVNAPTAMVIVSDGKDMGKAPLAAADAMKKAHGSRLCIYTVLVGDDPGGQNLLSRISGATGCGKAVTADSLATGSAMNAFVREVLLSGEADSDGDGVIDAKDKCPDTPRGVKVDMSGCPLDSDKDGVPDAKDQCPGTPEGVQVDAKGCPLPVPTKSAEVTAEGTWIYKDIQFEVNKADLRRSSYPVLDEIAGALKAQPGLNIEIQGHTDSTGAHDYNVGLSRRRAQSVKAYMVSKGIESGRMTTKGYGPDRPIASNTTKEGRARNRRVEVKPIR